MIVSVHQPQYIPWLGYFRKIAHSDAFVFLDCVQYKSREFQNRNKIRNPKGWMWLTVPVVSKGKGRQRIGECLIDNELPWARQHWHALQSCYGKAEYFNRYASFFEETYAKEWVRLAELNVHITRYLLEQFSICVPLYFESELDSKSTKTERIIDICVKLKADAYLSGLGGKEYLQEEKFLQAGIRLEYQQFTHPRYHQQFMAKVDDFIPYMSALDLLFNEGPGSREILLSC